MVMEELDHRENQLNISHEEWKSQATEIDLNLLVRTDLEGDLTPEEEEMILIDGDCLETSLNVSDVAAKTVKE